MQSRNGLPRSFLPSTSERACSRTSAMGTTSADVRNNAAAFAARTSGVPFFDRRGFLEWMRRQASFVARVRAGAELLLPLGLLPCYTKSMKKATPVKQKVMGRPRTGITPLMGFRADPVIRASIVRWAENQPDMPTLSEAIRRLVELGLKAKK